jgi:serine/threonine protein kinase
VLALKMIRGDVEEWMSQGAPLFRREAETVAKIRHPHIVELYDIGEHAGRLYYTMEFVEGGTLEQKFKGGPLPPQEAAELVEKMALALQTAHDADIVHRDMKPANVLLLKDGSPKVTDFGLAKWLNADASLLASTALVGTPSYMAPEQTEGKSAKVGITADVWALGAILYQALTGKLPFTAEDTVGLFAKIRSDEPASPRKLQCNLPRDLETICLKCLEKKPKNRYSSAIVLAERLRRFLDGQPIPERPRRWPAKTWRLAHRHPLLSAGILLVLLSVVGASLAAQFIDPERPRNQAKALLRNGRPYEYQVRKGDPGPFRWVFPTPDKLSTDADANTITIETLTTALYELLDDPGTDRYSFSMEVRHEDAGDASAAGMFVCLRRGVTAEGVQQYGFFAFHFADQIPRVTERDASGEPVSRPYVHWCACEKSDSVSPERFRAGPLFRPTLSWPQESKWRPMKVEVTGAGIASFWLNDSGEWVALRLLSAKEIETLLTRHQAITRERSNLPVDYQPRSGLGVYVWHGKASFRNVRLEPLPG